ncbi:MAG: magnesium transporter [Leptospirillia bacterium]
MSVHEISQRHALILDAVRRLLRRGAMRNLGKMVNKMHPAEVAKVVRHLDELAEMRILVSLIDDVEERAYVLSKLDEDSARGVFLEMPGPDQMAILQALSSDDAADLLGDLPPEIAQNLIARMPEGDTDVVGLLSYPEETAGGIMTPDFLAMPMSMRAGDAIGHLQGAPDAEMVFYIYAVDDAGRLKGVLSLRELLTVEPDTPLEEIMTTPVIRAGVDVDQEEVARLTARYNLLAVPVVDADEQLVGIITVDDVIDVIREEATEDMLKMSGTQVGAEYTLSMGSFHAARLRLPWLLVNAIGGMVSAWVMVQFTGTLQSALALVAFIPISMALGGSLGVQSSTIVVRGLATGRIELGDVRRVFLREVRVGTMVGLICGILVGSIAYLWHDPWLGAVVGMSLFVASGVAVTIGTLAPIGFQYFRIDPAISSGPLVTMVNDVTGLLIYLGLATLMLAYAVPVVQP